MIEKGSRKTAPPDTARVKVHRRIPFHTAPFYYDRDRPPTNVRSSYFSTSHPVNMGKLIPASWDHGATRPDSRQAVQIPDRRALKH
ncbi:hypothetical protein EYF80_016335 [Liparis tanakae]|uniref:Uncharacterized protein n=1 Tax=Liparis tanakae TaxID=230148 RepID=A0A4Z2I6L1_9TELE|nr:hypothetical protein EYF80_016335 [Liparis tanakae]